MLLAVCDIICMVEAIIDGSCRDIAAAKRSIDRQGNQHGAPTSSGVNRGRSKERVVRPPVEY